MERIEGSGASQLVQLIRAIGYNSDITLELATVTAPPPELKIKVDHMNVELEKDDLIVAQSLTKYTRKANVKSEGKTEVSSTSITQASVLVVSSGSGEITKFTSFGMSSANLTVQEAELEFTDELKKDDRVIVAGIHQGQTYLILDRAVMY
ncbi:MAG: DUF2577 domain-containing protein [Paenibacillaceae bacterium]|uniref:DUF2577 domain-containing protein n=1 Tax=Paenibacillus mellifer TaxID=2937794 RepID=A0A9X1XXH0_9BACL|nr:DUF2577 family protein [Paenibacillus mellifer]MBW4841169.1 DUF2577 domain-containing protein [Paenibacillaceae bacterium]MCK8487124.1 DUF2577 domain-containing protein [Paenibacillus mellifer]